MFRKSLGLIALLALLFVTPTHATADEREILQEHLPEVLGKLQENQLFYRDSMAVLNRLDSVEYTLDAAEEGSLSTADALAVIKPELEAARNDIQALKARRESLQPPVIGAPSYDRLFASSWELVGGLPDMLEERIGLMEAMGEAVQAGDTAAQDRLDSEATFQRLEITDGETANLRVSLALVEERHPQHGLTRAWIASNGANAALTRAIAEIFAGEAIDFAALVASLNNGARLMEAAIADGRDKAAKLGFADLEQAYQKAFDLETQIAQVNSGYGEVFAILIPEDGNWSDEDIARVNELDNRLAELVSSRTKLTIERTQLVQRMVQ
jgi:hypothetical protein